MHLLKEINMAYRTIACIVAVLISIGSTSRAEVSSVENGGDTFVAGPQVTAPLATSGDTFVSARTARVSGDAMGDLHISGFDVSVSADAAQDLYALGGTIVIRGNIAEDLSAAGFSVRTESTSSTSGNARLLGNTVTLDGPVMGALSVMGRDVILNAAIAGDVRVLAQTLSFGPDAVVSGTLTYSTEEKIAVPERVAPANRVKFEEVSGDRFWNAVEEMRKDMPVFPAFTSLLAGFVISLLFFVVLGALMLGLVPSRLERMRENIANAPGQSLLLGVIGLSVLFGMVPITALTIVGLPFAPIVFLAIVVAWTLGYALGAYSVAMRVWSGFGGEDAPGNMTRLLVFAAAIIIIALLNFIPFVGWVANYTLVLLGIGAMTNALFQDLIGNPGIALDIDMKPIKD